MSNFASARRVGAWSTGQRLFERLESDACAVSEAVHSAAAMTYAPSAAPESAAT